MGARHEKAGLFSVLQDFPFSEICQMYSDCHDRTAVMKLEHLPVQRLSHDEKKDFLDLYLRIVESLPSHACHFHKFLVKISCAVGQHIYTL